MVWGAISYDWKSPLVILEGTGRKGVRSEDYLEQVLKPIVSSAFHGFLGYDQSTGGLFIEDQAPIHGTKRKLVEAKKELGIPLLSRPACSPDLNPIENVWRTMKSRIKARATFPDTVYKMRQAVQEEWDRLEPGDWNGFVNSMPIRIHQVKQRRGMQTEF
jgi:hypothetical protein